MRSQHHELTPALAWPPDTGGRGGTGMKEEVEDTVSLTASYILSLSHVYYHEKSRHFLDLSTHLKLHRRLVFSLGTSRTATHSASHTQSRRRDPHSGPHHTRRSHFDKRPQPNHMNKATLSMHIKSHEQRPVARKARVTRPFWCARHRGGGGSTYT